MCNENCISCRCSFQQISQLLRDLAVSESARSTGFAREAVAAAKSIDDFPDELQAIISQVAVNIHGICVPISSPDNPKFDDFRLYLRSSSLHLKTFTCLLCSSNISFFFFLLLSMRGTFLCRRVVIDLFIAEGPNAKLKKAPIIEAANMKLKREIPQPEYQKVTSKQY